MKKEFRLVKNSTTPWACYKDPNSKLVYFVHSKCAGSFYKQLMNELNWQQITSVDVDWNSDIVFSHIRDPLKKHRIGIVEWFYFNNVSETLKNNATDMNFFQMLSHIAYLDHHSLSIYEHLGDNSRRVNWIPIDQPGVHHEKQTIEFIEQHSQINSNIKNWFLSLPPKHVSDGFKKKCYNILMDLPADPLILKSLEYDRCLYDSVTKKNYEPPTYPQRIDYLKSLGMTQIEAEDSADRDVETGEYLNWIL